MSEVLVVDAVVLRVQMGGEDADTKTVFQHYGTIERFGPQKITVEDFVHVTWNRKQTGKGNGESSSAL